MIRDAMLARLRAERAALLAVLDGATEAELNRAPEGRWSAAGILRHLMDFEADVVQGVAALNQGEKPDWFGVQDWDARNAAKAALWEQNPIEDLRAAVAASRAELERSLEGLDEAQLDDRRYTGGFAIAVIHDSEHSAGILERLALARGDRRTAAVQCAAITRNELLASLERMAVEAYEERLPEKWSIREILLHLAVRDRMWTEIVRRVSAGGSDNWPHTPEELDVWNQLEVERLSHLGAVRTLHLLGEARAEWNQAMLAAPDWLVDSPRYQTWAWRRFRHDRHHLHQIRERYRAWRGRGITAHRSTSGMP